MASLASRVASDPQSTEKIGTPGVHVSTAGEWEICYSLGTSVGDVTRLNVAIFVVYIADLEIFDCRYFC